MRWGILATGTIAAKFADTVNQMGDGQALAACASRTREKADAFAEKYGIARAYDSYEAMLEDREVEAVYVATPNNMHFENCRMCLEAGKHVLCEKPFTVSREEGEKLFALAKEKGLFIMEAFWTRHLPVMKEMQRLIREGAIGEVVWARSEFGFAAGGARKDRKFDSALAGGSLLDIGIYNLGFMRMVMGDEQPESFSSRYHINEYGTDDFSTMILSYPGGKYASITTCIGIPMRREAVVYGTGGSIYLEDFQQAERMVVKQEGKEARTVEIPVEVNGFEYQIREAERCIRLGMTESDVLKHKDTLEILDLMDRIRQSWGLKFACE